MVHYRLVRVKSFSSIHFVLNGQPLEIRRHAISGDNQDDLMQCMQMTIKEKGVHKERSVVEYTLSKDTDGMWTLMCYL